MRFRRAFAFFFLAACTKRHPATVDAPDAAMVVDAAGSIADIVPATPAAEPPIELAAEGGLAALLAGDASAKRLPEAATDDGGVLDRDLRRRLTTVELPDPRGLGQRATATVVIDGTSSTSPISDADRVSAGLRPRFRRCYETDSNSDTSMTGKVVVAAKIDKSGEVTDARVAANVGLSATVASCVAAVVKRATFSAPAGGNGATLTIPVTFSPPK